jgi:hypothetical protein
MPYIKQEERGKWKKIVEEIEKTAKNIPDDKIDGEMNYLITSTLLKIYEESYFNYNKAIGMIECVKQEFYRRRVAPYEDKKIKENGDVK